MVESGSQVLALCLSRQSADSMRTMVVEAPMAKLAGLELSTRDFERKALQLQPDILLVEYDNQKQEITELLERLRRSVPRGSVVAVGDSMETQDILQAMRLGVREYLPQPATGQSFNEAVLRLLRQTQVAGLPSGRLIAVAGVKGGVGTSHLAVNLAWGLSQGSGERVALVDLDLSGGDLSALLDVVPERDLNDVAANFNRLDAVLMSSLLTEVAPGLRLLAAPLDPVAAEGINAEHVDRALDYIADDHSLVIMDVSNRLDEVTLLAHDRADLLMVVLEPTVVGLKAARRLLDLSERLGRAPEKVAVIVNRDSSKGGLPHREVEKVLDHQVLAWLPNDSKVLMEAGNSGRPVLRDWPRAKWSKAVAKLAPYLLNGNGNGAGGK
ncbi:MAG: AAA family ATPase [Desulfarculaceae bacterium]